MALPVPPDYSAPIPNNPFYSPLQWYIQGPYNPLIVGSGLSVNSNTAYITSSGGGGGAVTGIFAGSGINVSGNTGNVTVSNTGVTALTAGAGISLSSSAGAVTITNTNNCIGTVTGINTGAGLTGGPITTSGTINLAISGVTAGVYTNPTLTVDSCGRILLASSNTVVNTISVTPPLTISGTTSPTLGVALGTTAGVGVVQLSNSINDAASVCAATTAAVKTAYDIAIAAIPKACITGQGALITGTAASTPVALPAGANGQVLTACSACAEGLYWGPTASVPSATPSVEGTVFGCTDIVNGNYGLGDCILQGLTTGFYNIALGLNSLCCLQSGNANVAIGPEAMEFSTTGCENVAVGFQASNNLTTGFWNVAIGANSMTVGAVTGFGNIALGKDSLNALTSGRDNVALGRGALNGVTTGRCNIGLGPSANSFISTGCFNIAVGSGINVANTAGNCQLAIGPLSGSCWLTGDSTLAIQPGAGIIDCAGSCGTAGQFLSSNGANAICWADAPTTPIATPATVGTVYGYVSDGTKANLNTSIGYASLSNITVPGAGGNSALGSCALSSLSLGSANVAVGTSSLFSGTSLCDNVAIGTQAGFALESSDGNTLVGRSSGLALSSGFNNVFLGSGTGASQTTGDCNVAIGPGVSLDNLTGSCQLAIGYGALAGNWLTGCADLAVKPGAGIIDCTATCGTANMVLTSQGNAVEWKPVNSAIGAPNYGSFINTASQTIATPGTPQPVTFDTTVASTNFSLNAGSQITATEAGLYNIQFSIQLYANPGGGGAVEIWFAKNGTAVPSSNTSFSIKNTNEAEFAALNFVDSLNAGDYIELFWSTADSDNYLYATTAPTALGGPAIPSVILTVVPVGA